MSGDVSTDTLDFSGPVISLDALDPAVKTFELRGARYALCPPSAETTNLYDRVTAMERAGEATTDAYTASVDQLLNALVPDMPADVRAGLTLAAQIIIIGTGMAAARAALARVYRTLAALDRESGANDSGDASGNAAGGAEPAAPTAPPSST